jgi:lipopolysaccharide heptosyltransferase I
VVHTLPILNLLRKRWPDAHIAWLLTPACAGLLEGHPLLNEVIHFDRRRFGQGWWNPASLFGLLEFTRSLRGREFDLVVDLQGLFRSGYLAWKTHSPVRVGFGNAREFAPWFYTHAVEIHTEEQHAIDRYLKVAAALGCDVSDVEFPFHVTDEDRAAVEAMVDGVGDYAVVLPGTNWATKRWPTERFAALIEPLRARFGLATVVAGGPGDVAMGDQIGGLNLCGKTTLRQLVALFQRAKVIVGNDSGPTHIAAALGKPLVAIYGPTNPVRTGPYRRDDAVLRIDIPCSPCYSRKCSHQSCLQWLGVEAVLEMVRQQVNAGAR